MLTLPRVILKLLKAALQERTGTKEDPLLASRNFNQQNQGLEEKVYDFAAALKKLFKNAYQEEAMTSTVLLQRFLTGLRPDIGRQLLLKKKPSDFSTTLKDAVDVEYALEFDNSGDSINSLTCKQPITSASLRCSCTLPEFGNIYQAPRLIGNYLTENTKISGHTHCSKAEAWI